MKLSIETHDIYRRFGDKETIRMIKAAGYDGIDYSFFVCAEGDEVLGSGRIEHSKSVKKLLEENGMTCYQAHAPFSFTFENKFEPADPEFKKLIHAIEAASVMGAEYIVIHGITTPPHIDNFEYNLNFYKSLEPYAKEFSIKIAIENLFVYNKKTDSYHGKLHTPAILKRMIKSLDSDSFVICLDIGHAGITGIEPEDMIKALGNDILKVLHVHDNDYKNDQHLPPYHGKFNWENIMSALKEINFDGDFSLELISYMSEFEDELIQNNLNYTANIGRHLIKKYENA